MLIGRPIELMYFPARKMTAGRRGTHEQLTVYPPSAHLSHSAVNFPV